MYAGEYSEDSTAHSIHVCWRVINGQYCTNRYTLGGRHCPSRMGHVPQPAGDSQPAQCSQCLLEGDPRTPLLASTAAPADTPGILKVSSRHPQDILRKGILKASSGMGPWPHGSMASRAHGLRIHGLMGPWPHGSMASWVHGLMGPWPHGTMASWVHGLTGSWPHGSMASWVHGLIGPWPHGSMASLVHDPAPAPIAPAPALDLLLLPRTCPPVGTKTTRMKPRQCQPRVGTNREQAKRA